MVGEGVGESDEGGSESEAEGEGVSAIDEGSVGERGEGSVSERGEGGESGIEGGGGEIRLGHSSLGGAVSSACFEAFMTGMRCSTTPAMIYTLHLDTYLDLD